jgi:hypothetical protein
MLMRFLGLEKSEEIVVYPVCDGEEEGKEEKDNGLGACRRFPACERVCFSVLSLGGGAFLLTFFFQPSQRGGFHGARKMERHYYYIHSR